MKTPIRVLIGEASPEEAEPLVVALRRAGYDPTWVRVGTVEQMRAALQSGPWDIILCDYALPQLSAVAALTMAAEVAPGVPFVVVSGTAGEEAAVEAMRAGASNYVLKRNLARLAPAVSQALREAEGRRGRTRAGEARPETEERLRQLLDNLPHMVWLNEPDGTPVYLNRRCLDYCGVPPGVMYGWDWRQVVHPDDLPATLEAASRKNRTGEPMLIEYRLRRQDGQYRWHVGRSLPLRDGEGRVVKWVGTATDVDDQKRAEEALRRREGEYRLLVDAIPAIIWVAGPDGANVHSNRQWYDYTGLRPEETLANGWERAIHPDDVATMYPRWAACVASGQPYDCEHRIRRADGAYRWHLIRATPLRDGEGRVLRWYGTCTDIHDRKQAEASVLLRDRAIRAVASGILITDPNQPDNPVVYASPGFERLTGYAQGEVLGRNCRFLQGPDTDPGAVAYVRELVAVGREGSVELLNYKKDGTPFWNALSVSPVRDEAGRLTHFVGVQTDVTERRRLEEQFRQAQKMEAVGRLAGGVAHDFNNLLTVINGYSSVLLAALHEHDRSRPAGEEIHKAGERAAALTGQLLAFSRKQILQPKVLDLNALIVNVRTMLGRLIGEDVELVTTTTRDLAPIKADPTQVEQVLLNLAVNARDAMPRGGRLTVETANVVLDEAAVKDCPEVRPGPYVLLAVTDTGTGMDRGTQDRIFEPFFTTKGPGKGTGLGLAMVYGFVKSSDGHIRVESDVGAGTTFKVYFPALAGGEAAGDKATAAGPRGGTETVLVVEDEAGVRELVGHLLGQLGYRVLRAANGAEALAVAVEHKGRIDLLLADVVLPGMSGPQVAEALLLGHPEARVLYLSGYTDDAVFRHGVQEAETAFLQKPFTTAALAAKVRAVLKAAG